jgi:hypothetical protein
MQWREEKKEEKGNLILLTFWDLPIFAVNQGGETLQY